MNHSSPYAGYIRYRVGGILEENGNLLLVKLPSPITNEDIWIPPGGGVDFGESAPEALVREFKEETGLSVSVRELLHINEIIFKDFHVIEHFFKVQRVGGKLALGLDPEHPVDDQLLSDIGFFSREEIEKMNIRPGFIKEEYWHNPKMVSFNSQR
ncbi:MAG: NUDIX domain-containing protein [Balneolaceae bacterium]|nr:NUDIX domain-containing protein [Balneolaceae bacterium]